MIEMDIKTYGNKIGVIGVDRDRESNQYFNMIAVKDQVYQFKLPQSPNVLKFYVFDINEGEVPESTKFFVEKISLQRVKNKNQLIVDEDMAEFLRFSQKFAKNADILKPGKYKSRNGKFIINYYQTIEDDTDTPSRINIYDNEIDVSKEWFRNMTVPGRNAMLQHEFSHNYLDDPLDEWSENKEIEKRADKNAAQIYKAIGYPGFEWMYSWLYIFDDVDDHIERLDASDANMHV